MKDETELHQIREVARSTEDIAPVTQQEGQTDIANAERFQKRYDGLFAFAHEWHKWLAWDGKRWQIDNEEKALHAATVIAEGLWLSANSAGVASHCKYSSSRAGLKNMLAVAQCRMPIAVADLNQHPYLLNCENGTVDLRTGQIRPHDPSDNLTTLCHVEFAPDAMSELWDEFLRGVFPDVDLRDYMQKLMGYAVVGVPSEQFLPIFYGTGANGKSTFLEAIGATVGQDYYGPLAPKVLLKKKHNSHPTEIADLHGKRIVVAQETDKGDSLNEGLVKQLTGGDTLKGRRMHEDFWAFTPTHTLFLCTNHKPRIEGDDYAIWRRLTMIPFTERFDGDNRDASLPQKLTGSDVKRAILNWLIKGAMSWCNGGMTAPDAVKAATVEYQREEDSFGEWLSENCDLNGGRVKLDEFTTRFNADTGDHLESRKVSKMLRDKGFKKVVNNGTYYEGLTLKEQVTEGAEDVSS